MKRVYAFLLGLLEMFILCAQTGNVGINTDQPEKTLDVNGELRIRKIEQDTKSSTNRLLMADDSGIVKIVKTTNFGVMGSTKISGIGIGTSNTPIGRGGVGNGNSTIIIRYDEVRLDDGEISYDEKTGEFKIKKAGYYFISSYSKIDPNGSEKNYHSVVIKKNNDTVSVSGIYNADNKTEYNHYLDLNTSGTEYFNADDILKIEGVYNGVFNVRLGNVTIVYLGDRLKPLNILKKEALIKEKLKELEVLIIDEVYNQGNEDSTTDAVIISVKNAIRDTEKAVNIANSETQLKAAVEALLFKIKQEIEQNSNLPSGRGKFDLITFLSIIQPSITKVVALLSS